MQQREIDISEYWEGENPKVVIKRLSFGAQNEILDRVANVNMKNKQLEVAPRYGELRTLTLQKCLVSAPFPIDLEYIRNELDAALGEFLFNQIEEFNTLKKEVKKV